MTSELAYEASDEASENELLDRSLSVWRGWSAIEWEDFTPIALDIHTASSIGQYDWVRSLIARNDGLALDRKNHGGWTPLMYACYIGHDNVVNLLINAGCQMNMKNPRGHTPLILAASCGNESVARTLIRNGAELELTDKCGWTALFHATYAGHQNFVAFLLETGANMDAVEPVTGMTPFMEAAAEGHEIIVQLFLQHGVNVTAKAYNGDMARSLALINGYMKIVSLIDNHVMPLSSLRSEPGLDFYLSSSDDGQFKPRSANVRTGRGKSKGPSIRDGPEAIARMIDRTRNTDVSHYPTTALPKGYVAFTGGGDVKGAGTHLSHRDVTSPINPDDYKDNSGTTDFDDDNDESNAFTKTGAITIKSSSSSSGGLMAALGLSREGSIDSDDSHSPDLTTASSDPSSRMAEDSEGHVKDIPSEVTSDCNDLEQPNCHTDLDKRIGTNLVSKGEKDVNVPPLTVVPSEDTTSADKDKPWAVVSPLRDYFPLEIPFQVGITSAPTQSSDQVSAQISSASKEPSTTQSLPMDNMTQAEIVSRYLNHLSLATRPGNSSSGLSQQTNAHGFHSEAGSSNVLHNVQGGHWGGGSAAPANDGHQRENAVQNPLLYQVDNADVTRDVGNLLANQTPVHFMVQDSSLPKSVNFVPKNSFSTGLVDAKSSQHPLLPPFIQHQQQQQQHHPSCLLPTSHHHHHHHHHFHGSQQPQELHNTQASRPSGDQAQQHQLHYQLPGAGADYMSAMSGYYNLQQQLIESQSVDVHSYLQTVPPELYYQDVDSSPQYNSSKAGQSSNVVTSDPAFIMENVSPSDIISLQASPVAPSLGNTKSRDISQIHNKSDAIHCLQSGSVMSGMPENAESKSPSVQSPKGFQGWQTNAQTVFTPVSNPSVAFRNSASFAGVDLTSASQNSSCEVKTTSIPLPSHDTHETNIFYPSDTQKGLDLISQNTAALPSNKDSKHFKFSDHSRPSSTYGRQILSSPKPVVQAETIPAAVSQHQNQLPPRSMLDQKMNELSQEMSPAPKTSVSQADSSSSLASVMIPGHAISQPVSQSISWLSQNERVGGGPSDLRAMLTQLGLTKYLDKFEEQDVDLHVFLSLTDNDLKELGIKLFGPRKKMTNAIARWHSKAPLSCSELEQAYANRLEGEMQEMAIQLNQACANEESLKAEVLQEQQLRSVTEGCLMEMRMNWCQARQLIQEARSTLRTMGELLSRLRYNQKDLKKTLVNSMKDLSQSPAGADSTPSKAKDAVSASRGESAVREAEKIDGKKETAGDPRCVKTVTEVAKGRPRESLRDGHSDKDERPDCSVGETAGVKMAKDGKAPHSDMDSQSLEIVKKSDKCVKDLHQALTNLIHNIDHILKSTQNMNAVEKELT